MEADRAEPRTDPENSATFRRLNGGRVGLQNIDGGAADSHGEGGASKLQHILRRLTAVRPGRWSMTASLTCSSASHQLLHLRLRLLQPEPHVHLAEHRRGDD